MAAIPPPSAPEVRALLGAARLFKGLPDEVLDEIGAELEWWVVGGGETVCAQGDVGDYLYLVASGRLAVVRTLPSGEEVVLREAGRGETVGELAVLTDRPRTATVRTLRDTVLVRLSRDRFEGILQRHAAVLRSLAGLLAEWLDPAPAVGELPAAPLSLTLVAITPGLPMADLAAGLHAALARTSSALVASAAAIDDRFGAGAADSPDGSPLHGRVTAWLAEQEATHRYVVYLGDAAATPWTRRCLRQADRVLVVADAGAEPGLGALAGVLVPAALGKSREELVLLHPGSADRPRATAGWLALYPFDAHHHLRRGRAADLERLARLASGQSIGVVLGGGGARGFAHIGVLRALEEAGVPIDRIGGASMGAIIAAQYARGCGWQEMVDLNRRGWVEMAPHKVYTLPVVSLLSKVKAEVMLDMMFAGGRIEDLWLPFFCVSTNITRTEVKVHRDGPIRRALSASITIPGITPPVVDRDGDLLVDGGVLNNLPTDVMRRFAPGRIIASDVSAAVDLRADPSWEDPPTPWQYLSNRMRRAGKPRPFPNILNLIMRAALLASDVYAKQAKREVDLYLDLPMDPFDMFDMERLEDIVEFGYRFACEKIAEAPWLTPAATPPPAP